MKLLWRLSREAKRYRGLYLAAILATLALTGVNLAVPKLLSTVTDVVEGGVDAAGLQRILRLTAWLAALYLLRVCAVSKLPLKTYFCSRGESVIKLL